MGEGRRWVYVQCGVADLHDITPLLQHAVAPWLAEWGPSLDRWFFLQYADPTGLALRLRVRSRTELAVPGIRCSLRRALIDHGPVIERIYAPEYEKFGGPAGVALAEEIFELGSVAAMTLRDHPDRTGLGAAHLLAATASLEPDVARVFLYNHAWYWSGRGRLGPLWDSTIRRLDPDTGGERARRVRGAGVKLLADPTVGPVLTNYAADVEAALRRARPSSWGHRDALVRGAHLHLMNNRLGILPAQEAQLARLLYLSAPSTPQTTASAAS